MIRIFFFILIILGFINDDIFAQSITKIGYKEIGKASYYPDDRDGVITQGGYRYHKDSMYVAHKYFPFGSIIKVRNVNNGKIIQLKVIDRPYTSRRIIDMTYAAGQKLDIIGQNEVSVEITLIDTPKTLKEKQKREKEIQLKKKVAKEEELNVDVSRFKNVGTYSITGNPLTIEGYGIQFATSSDIKYTLTQGEFIQKNFLIKSIYIQTGWSNGERVYRLLIGKFTEAKDADPLIQLLKSGGYTDCFIKKHHNN